MAEKNKSLLKVFFNGILNENPTFRLVLGMCPTLAITTAASQGVGMGLATTAVLVCSNLFISILRNIIPEKVRIPAFIVVIASFVTMVQMVIKAFLPALDQSLGIFIPLIVVNCIIFARAEAFAFKNKPIASVMDGLGMGLGFTGAITLLSAIRELISAGTIFGAQIMPETYQPMGIIGQPAGGFITLGILLAVVNAITKAYSKRKAARKEEMA
ncbi:MAG: electron transport complex subunit E [Clostridia bacterium]|nr:electron transport complex subunit E [Clostridia bacterium]